MKQAVIIFIKLVLPLTLTGCGYLGLYLANSLTHLDNYTAIENIAYGDHELNRLSVYLPEHKSSRQATVIFFYGGCWGGCETLNKEDYLFVAQALTAQGFNVVIPDYRRHPEVKFDGIMRDASHVVEWVKAHIAEYGGDSNKLFLMGHSAGAHIAALLTLNETYLKPSTYQSIKGFIGLAGPYDFLPFTDDYQLIVFGPVKNYPNTQPVNFVDGTEPPLLLLYGNDDSIVKPVNIESLTRTVQRKGGHVEAHRYDGINHVAIMGALTIPFQTHQPILHDVVAFVNHSLENR